MLLGGRGAVTSMVQTALAPHAETATIADSHWVAQTADHILTVMEASRSTWQRPACPGRSATTGPHDQRDGRTSECLGGPAGR